MGRHQGPERKRDGPHDSQSLIIGKLILRDMFTNEEMKIFGLGSINTFVESSTK